MPIDDGNDVRLLKAGSHFAEDGAGDGVNHVRHRFEETTRVVRQAYGPAMAVMPEGGLFERLVVA